MNIQDLLDRPIAFQRVFVSIGVGIGGALMLSQAVYWSKRTKAADGWFYKTREEWEEETGMARAEQERARKALCAVGVMNERRRGIPAKLYFRVDFDALAKALAGEIRETTLEELKRDFSSVLLRLSKTTRMTAKKNPDVAVDRVDFIALLEAKGMVCGICGEPISYGLGKHSKALAFAYKTPLLVGGYNAGNIIPAHFMCKEMQCADEDEKLSRSTVDQQDNQPTSRSTVDQLDGLPKTSSVVVGRPTNTETTAETTAEITSPSGQQPATPSTPGALVESVAPRVDIPADMPGPKDQSCKTFKAWANYAFAYRKRYSCWPVWNAAAGGMLGKLIDNLGAEVAHSVAAYYVGINDARLINDCHSLRTLLAKADAYHTQWITGRQVNGTTARQMENTQANINAAQEAGRRIIEKGVRNEFL